MQIGCLLTILTLGTLANVAQGRCTYQKFLNEYKFSAIWAVKLYMTFFCLTPTSKNNKYDFAMSPRFRTWIVEVYHIFVSTCKISTIHRTISFRAQKFWNGSEILPRGESFQTSKSFVFRKFLRNFVTKTKRKIFSIKTQKFYESQ